ncbi:hypothetical protein RRU01S_03_01980 [Agrobacterium rubi TR3 = NBRC 13261]|uniref:Activator of Hsp90 ATPase homologue 1/2-like C-terminal domain-containing protein n=1 Tax=Agrobacterium rubi TR3 = NBRC 13261 TaxID=1368415 RepID=A0A081CQT1_9HYPH|nr:SRPBCC family protein [Agrobacterium rubi]MBP1877169.1 uncharacterized protein YndB with AHSA1/START domain [Agrobacterium rubi]MCL6651353.1 polyketide cyclase [Agrobacterium rubi]GAK69027.1 hypothetical protein RRU01S_03_01980 [Agrobacterium rubi TR3 = NBRC 13261]
MPNIAQHELSLSRIINAPAEKVFQAWTDPDLLVQWWAPVPYRTSQAFIELRPGGSFNTTMHAPTGEVYENFGVFLDVVPNQRLIFTDAFRAGWVPGDRPFMTGHITFEDAGSGTTKYTARAQHWTAEDKLTHEEMGFHEGWNAAAEQMEALLQRP